MATFQIRILNFEKYKGRTDVVHNSWFRCSNRILEDHEFFDFTHEELLVWIYLLSISSQKNTSDIVVSHQHAHQVCRLSEIAVTSAVEKLCKIKCIERIRTRTLRGRYAHDTQTCATDRQDITNKQDITIHNTSEEQPAAVHPKFALSADFLFFNSIKPIKPDLVAAWIQGFDEDWVLSEMAKARIWCLANPKRSPKNSSTFLTNWFSKGWERHRKTLPAEKPKSDYSFLSKAGNS